MNRTPSGNGRGWLWILVLAVIIVVFLLLAFGGHHNKAGGIGRMPSQISMAAVF